MVVDAMDSYSNKAGDLMEEVYQYMTQKCYMYLLRCTEGRKRSEKQPSFSLFFLPLFHSFVVVLTFLFTVLH